MTQEEFYLYIRELLRLECLEDVAAATGLHISTLHGWLADSKRRPKDTSLIKVGHYFGYRQLWFKERVTHG